MRTWLMACSPIGDCAPGTTSARAQELEFLLEADGFAVPVEVKSSSGATASPDESIKRFDPPYVYKLISSNVGFNPPKRTLPLHMAIFL